MKKFTLPQFQKDYRTNEDCLQEVFEARYGSLEVCPKCSKKTKFHKISGRKCYCCQYCGFQLHPLAGTIFHKSDTPLTKWFYAIYLFGVSKNGVSAKELERHLGVTYKCAWRMARQIRLLFQNGSETPLKGIVEADESFIGGYQKGSAGRSPLAKVPVLGMVERGGSVRAQVVPDTKASSLAPILRKNIEPGSTLITDTYQSYEIVGREFDHKKINHKKERYVNGSVYTNTIEGFWSQLKRSINGTYHSVSKKHLQLYVNEFAWRYSNRKNEEPLFFPMIELASKPLK